MQKQKYNNFIKNHNLYYNALLTNNIDKMINTFENYNDSISALSNPLKKNLDSQNKKLSKFFSDLDFFTKMQKISIFDEFGEKKDFCKNFPYLTYFIYNILVKIWTHKTITEKDLENISEKEMEIIIEIVKKKFEIQISITNFDKFIINLNLINKLRNFKRKEECVKIVSRNFLKYLENYFSFEFLKNIIRKKHGLKKFQFYFFIKKDKLYIKKFHPGLKRIFLEIEIFKEKYADFKLHFLEIKKKSIEIFFQKLMEKIGLKYDQYKNLIKNPPVQNLEILDEKYPTDDFYKLQYPWTINQLEYALNFFQKIIY